MGLFWKRKSGDQLFRSPKQSSPEAVVEPAAETESSTGLPAKDSSPVGPSAAVTCSRTRPYWIGANSCSERDVNGESRGY